MIAFSGHFAKRQQEFGFRFQIDLDVCQKPPDDPPSIHDSDFETACFVGCLTPIGETEKDKIEPLLFLYGLKEIAFPHVNDMTQVQSLGVFLGILHAGIHDIGGNDALGALFRHNNGEDARAGPYLKDALVVLEACVGVQEPGQTLRRGCKVWWQHTTKNPEGLQPYILKVGGIVGG